MIRSPQVTQRLIEKQKFLAFIKAHPGVSIEELKAKYSAENGFKCSTLDVYYRELKDAKLIEVK